MLPTPSHSNSQGLLTTHDVRGALLCLSPRSLLRLFVVVVSLSSLAACFDDSKVVNNKQEQSPATHTALPFFCRRQQSRRACLLQHAGTFPLVAPATAGGALAACLRKRAAAPFQPPGSSLSNARAIYYFYLPRENNKPPAVEECARACVVCLFMQLFCSWVLL